MATGSVFFVSFGFARFLGNFVVVVIDFEKYDLSKAKELASKFGAAALTEMAFNIQQMSLVQKGELLRSLKFSVGTKSGEVDRVNFMYEWYGKIQENGAENVFGKGVSISPNRWRSAAISQHMEKLNDDFSEFYASLIMDELQVDSVKMKM